MKKIFDDYYKLTEKEKEQLFNNEIILTDLLALQKVREKFKGENVFILKDDEKYFRDFYHFFVDVCNFFKNQGEYSISENELIDFFNSLFCECVFLGEDMIRKIKALGIIQIEEEEV